MIALLIHIYKLVNTLPNHDSLFNYYSDQNVLGSGRWALSAACGISSFYDLPWINGLFSCVFIALTVVVIVALFRIKNPILIALTGGLLAASPSTTETFFFMFTADGYMLAMLLAALAVYFSRIEEKRKSFQLLSGICVCVCCGIYQAYVSFALVLAVCYFLDVLFQNTYGKKECMRWVLRQILIYIGALAAYYVIWKLCLYFTDTPINHYQGIEEVGKISIGLILGGFMRSIKTTMLYFLQWDIFEHGLTLYAVLNIAFVVVLITGIVLACVKSKIFKRKWATVLMVLCLLSLVPFACMWHFTSETVGYRAMMLQSFTLLFVFTAVLYEKWGKAISKNLICIFLLGIIFHNALMANVSYFYMNLCYERTYADGIVMISEIHELEKQYEFDKIAVLGDRLPDVQWTSYDDQAKKAIPAEKIHILSGLLETNLMTNSDHLIPFLNVTFDIGLEPQTQVKIREMIHLDEVQEMTCWPQEDSMKVIDDTLVIKLADIEEGE